MVFEHVLTKYLRSVYDKNGTITYKRIDDKFKVIKKEDYTNE